MRDSSHSSHSDPRIHTFVREDDRWYIDLPLYLDKGGSKEDLLMEGGADDILDFLSMGKKKVNIMIDTLPFESCDTLELAEVCGPPMGGGYYRLHAGRGRVISEQMWIRDIALFLFGDLPQQLYVKRIRQPLQ
ncbi:DUF6717 family protein [Paraflavisolibacter sp. H34]|uniref:DUF6717 family protein n=1 Tax=Huijunlia imazamoxiresistens TaxID=3127457 RepID=UPI0030170196